MHIVSNKNSKKIKELIKEKLKDYEINHTTIELEDEICNYEECKIDIESNHSHHH